MYRNSYVEIDEIALANNIKSIKKEYKGYKYYFAIVKANAYGHGEYLVKEMINQGINYLAVSSLEEAISVRKYNKDIPILCLGYIDPKDFHIVEKYNITITIISYEYFNKIKKNKSKIKAHLKLNTGMNRLGVSKSSEVSEIVNTLKKTNIKLEGIYTHFATAGVMDFYWNKQVKKFEELTSQINLEDIEIVHLYNSASILNHKKYKFANGVRLGIILYGLFSTENSPKYKKLLFNFKMKSNFYDKDICKPISNNIKLKKIMKIYSEVISINKLTKGSFVGYQALFKAKRNTNIATICIGHADGITADFKFVKINKKTYPIVAVCMDYIMVEVDDSVKVRDKVVIIDDGLTIEKVAIRANDSAYHILVSIGNRLPRIYKKDNKEKIIKY